MQDQDAPPVEEGETGGGVAVVPEADIRRTGPGAINTVEFIPRPWTTAIARLWPVATMDRGQDGRVRDFRRIIPKPIPILCRFGKTRRRGFLASLTISF